MSTRVWQFHAAVSRWKVREEVQGCLPGCDNSTQLCQGERYVSEGYIQAKLHSYVPKWEKRRVNKQRNARKVHPRGKQTTGDLAKVQRTTRPSGNQTGEGSKKKDLYTIFRHHHWQYNSRAFYLDCFWSPNVRTLILNGLEILPHCIAGLSESDLRSSSLYDVAPRCYAVVKWLSLLGDGFLAPPQNLHIRATQIN